MAYLQQMYEKCPKIIRDNLSYQDMCYFIFNGPTTPTYLQKYLGPQELSAEKMAAAGIVLARKLVIEFGISDEAGLAAAQENMFQQVLDSINKTEEELFAELGKAWAIRNN